MNELVCDMCKKKFDKKFNYERHIQRKNKCVGKHHDIVAIYRDEIKMLQEENIKLKSEIAYHAAIKTLREENSKLKDELLNLCNIKRI